MIADDNQRTSGNNSGAYPESLAAFVQRNREHFDDEVPNERVWQGIEASLGTGHVTSSGQPRNRRDNYRQPKWGFAWTQLVAAVALLLIGLGVGLWVAQPNASTNPVVATAPATAAESMVQRVDNLERAYQKEIDRRLRQVAAYSSEPALDTELSGLTRPTGSTIAELSKAAPGSERAIVEGMVIEYQTKLDALEHVLRRLQAKEAKVGPMLNRPGPAKRVEEM